MIYEGRYTDFMVGEKDGSYRVLYKEKNEYKWRTGRDTYPVKAMAEEAAKRMAKFC